jgi:cephalosporin-C deacetylase-like acetyl esterase
MMLQSAALAATAFCPLHRTLAQDAPGDAGIRRYLAARAAEMEREFLPGVKTAADFERLRPQLRADFFDMLGLKPMPERTPLKATVTGKVEQPGYTLEKLHFQSLPGLYVTANLYLPKPARGRYPTILYQVGHYNAHRRDGNKAAPDCLQQGAWFATHGYVALMMDTIELSEIAGLHRGLLGEKRWWWHSVGYTPAGVETWNAMRALDYLVTRPEVDASRLGATGISGGGIGTFWIAAADDRIKVAVPVSGMGDATFYAGEDGISRHCDCFFLYNHARWNWTNICALIAPRPMLFVNSDNDYYFPMPNNERIAARLERLYSLFGASDQMDAMVSIGPHSYRTDIRRAAYEFFNRHFKNDARRVTDADFGLNADGTPMIERKLVRVFPEDSDFPKDSINKTIDEQFVRLPAPTLPAKDKYEAWRDDLLRRLRRYSFAAWPVAAPAVYAPTLGNEPRAEKEATEDGIEVHWRWLPGKGAARWLVVLNPGEDLKAMPEWARAVVGEDSALLLAPRGVGPSAWTRDKFPHPIERALATIGATADSGRVWDVMTVAGRYGTSWRATGRGQAGIIALYAALYQPAIESVVAVEPPASHRPRVTGEAYGPAFLHVARVLDIPEAMGCLAPRPLTLIGAQDAAFARTAAIYQVAGVAGRFIRT